MHTSPSIFERIQAALTFFTRLPLGSPKVSAEAYRHVVPLWPLMGWLTGGLMAGIYVLSRLAGLDAGVAVVLALAGRVMLTGALHEDGLADFCDGFGGRDRSRTLEIMKDSHIGTYGVLGLVIYFLLISRLLTALVQGGMSPLMFIAVDAVCKFLSSTIIWFLPYVRREEEAKNRLIYAHTTAGEKLLSLVLGFLPIVLILTLTPHPSPLISNSSFLIPNSTPSPLTLLLSFCASALCCAGLFGLMHRRLGGYTGDCCGATFLLTELTFYFMLSCLL
ncbi:MAG: adenosylcobinamide-GDP ribazoletransferase [Bacteroidaceae bacterium]|nr:adenosylcobinamide-GDP ribazoletransferase [Bacteroidaceae bacterium]